MIDFIDENFWVAISFCIFVLLAFRPIKRAIVNSLDARINEIKKTLYETQKLRDDAKIILEQIGLEMQHFEDRKSRIMESAENSTSRLVETKSKEIEVYINRARDSAGKSITHLKNKASFELKEEFTHHVVSLVRTYMTESDNNSVTEEEIINHLLSK